MKYINTFFVALLVFVFAFSITVGTKLAFAHSNDNSEDSELEGVIHSINDYGKIFIGEQGLTIIEITDNTIIETDGDFFSLDEVRAALAENIVVLVEAKGEFEDPLEADEGLLYANTIKFEVDEDSDDSDEDVDEEHLDDDSDDSDEDVDEEHLDDDDDDMDDDQDDSKRGFQKGPDDGPSIGNVDSDKVRDFRENHEEGAPEIMSEERRAELHDAAMGRIGEFIDRMFARFDAAIERLNSVADRIESRIEKFEERGVDLTTAKNFLADARAEIEAAEDALNTAETEARVALEGDSGLRDTFAIVRELVGLGRDALRAAHGLLVDSIEAIRADTPDDIESADDETDEESNSENTEDTESDTSDNDSNDTQS